MSSRTNPIPILKTSHPDTHHSSHHVHFSSTVHTFTTHAISDYDRTPLRVPRNPCELPERGCPGLTYVPMDSYACAKASSRTAISTRAIPPDTSEGEDSDGLISPPPEPHFNSTFRLKQFPNAQQIPPEALTLLPHAGTLPRKERGKRICSVPGAQVEDYSPENRSAFRSFSDLSSTSTAENDCLGGF